MCTLLTVGHVTYDAYGSDSLPGGSVYYAGLTWRALGGEARIVTAAGEDFDTRAELPGVEVRALPATETTRFINHYTRGPQTGERQQIIAAQAAAVPPQALPHGWKGADVLFLAPVLDEVDLTAWRRAVSSRWVAVGLQGWLKARGSSTGSPDHHRVVRSKWPGDTKRLSSLMEGVDILFLSDEDMGDDSTLLSRLVDHVPMLVLTHGPRGCRIYSNGESAHVGVYRPHPDRPAVDPTGAGDCFAAGFLYAIARGAEGVDAARLGAAAASIVIEAPAGGALPLVSAAFERAPLVPVT